MFRFRTFPDGPSLPLLRHKLCVTSDRMFTVLCIIGVVWFSAAALFVLALALAARKPMPLAEADAVLLEEAA